MGPTWGPPRPQVGPMFAPWTLLSGKGCLLGEVTGQKDKHADRQDFIVVDWTGWRAHGTLRLDADKHEMSPANQDTDRMWQVSKLQWLFFICWSLFDKIIKKLIKELCIIATAQQVAKYFFLSLWLSISLFHAHIIVKHTVITNNLKSKGMAGGHTFLLSLFIQWVVFIVNHKFNDQENYELVFCRSTYVHIS